MDSENQTAHEPLWQPSAERVSASQIDRFRVAHRPEAADSDELWQWSVDEPGSFWRAVWEWSGVVGDPGSVDIAPGDRFQTTRFFPDATLNVAENLLAPRDGAGEHAIISAVEQSMDEGTGPTDEVLSWDDLRSQVAAMASALRSFGVVSGDRVAAWMPHRSETIVAFLAAASIGAVFTSTSADFGVDGVVDRFGQTGPKVLLAADGYRYGGKSFPLLDRLAKIAASLPTVEQVLVVGALTDAPDLSVVRDGIGQDSSAGPAPVVSDWNEVIAANAGADLVFEQLPADHPLYVLFPVRVGRASQHNGVRRVRQVSRQRDEVRVRTGGASRPLLHPLHQLNGITA